LHKKPHRRLTALQMLEHPWTKGQTALSHTIKGSDERLKAFRRYKSQLEVKVFSDWIADASSDAAKKTSLLERAFKSFDIGNKGYVTTGDIGRSLTGKKDTESETEAIGLSGFSNLLGDNMESQYFEQGHRIYKEGASGDAIYLINSGTVEVSTRTGFKTTLSQGQMFGEGALLEDDGRRSATVKCKTPVHVIKISKQFYRKYTTGAGGSIADLTIREQHRARHKDRALKILRLQKRLVKRDFSEGDVVVTRGEEGTSVFILDQGMIRLVEDDILVPPGEVLGEHALLTNLPRNATGVCDSAQCVAYELSAKDFTYMLRSMPEMKTSFRDICFRRDFEKAMVSASSCS
jgi:CRP/FNR family cyclic AMP-dependent transcriptional regulator